jgi:hypothetical protein
MTQPDRLTHTRWRATGKALRHRQYQARTMPAADATFNSKNLRGQTLLFRCLETRFVATAPALGRYQRGRGIDPSQRELVGERPAGWIKGVPTTICDHCGMVVKGNQWAFRQHQQTKRCQKAQRMP